MINERTLIYSILFTVVITANVFFLLLWKPIKEHFTVEQETETETKDKEVKDVELILTNEEQSKEAQEDLRLFIIKAFDVRYQRNPTPEEIDTYMKKNKDEIEKELTKGTLIDDVSNVTFSKAFIQTKIETIQKQLDDLKRLI